MASANNLITISPSELDAWLDTVRAERWPRLAIVGPGVWLSNRVEEWPPTLKGVERVIRVKASIASPADKLRRLPGLTSLVFLGFGIGDEGAKAIAASLTGLTSLDLWSNDIGDEGAKAIAASLTGLTSLDLWSNTIGDEGAKAIAASLTGLTSLNVGGNTVGAEGAKAIAASLTGLTSLDLRVNNIGAEGAKAIAASLTGLTSLDLSSNTIGAEGAKAIAASLTGLTSLDLWSNDIGAEGAKAIAASLTGLTSLNVGGNTIGDEGAKAIAASLTGLTSLNLSWNTIGAEGAKAIAASLTGLTSLDLWSNDIGDEGAKAIAASLTGLTSLDLDSNDIGAEGAKAIAASLTGLTSLDLRNNNIRAEGAKAIAASLTGLTSLDLRVNNIGAEGAKAIAASLTGLTSLDLSSNTIGAEGAKAIAASLTGLTSLDLWSNDIGAEGAKAIAASLTGLTSLNVGGNTIGDEGAKAIAASLTGLTSLDLGSNDIGAEGAKAIAASLTGLTSLDLRVNDIGAEGAKAIAASLAGLTSLDLSSNTIGDEGAKAIAASLTGLTSLDLGSNDIGAEGAKAIAASLTGLTSLDLDSNDIGAEGAKAIAASLTGLTSLDLRNNNIRAEGAKMLLDAWSARPDSAQLRRLELRDNGDLSSLLPKEALETSDDAQVILAAYRTFKRAKEEGTAQPLNEVKLLVVGNEAVGKTSLLRYLIHNKPRDPSEDHPRLKHVRDPIPNNWLAIKSRLRELTPQRSVLPNAEFVPLCENPASGVEKIADANEQRALLQLLHQLGVIVAHGLSRESSAASREITLLDPNWLTGAIYRVLEMAKSNECDGEFSRAHLTQWLDPNVYPSRWHEFILTMMQDSEVGLCFRLPAQGEERYLIPEALTPGAPERRRWPEEPLRFRYRYGFLPPGLIPRFIVQSHRNLTGKRSRFKQGVELVAAGCDMLIVADLEDRRVDIEVAGPEARRRSALEIVLNDLDAVHRFNPEAEPVALVPLPDNPKAQVGYGHLLMLEREKGPDYAFFPEGATREYKVSELLDGVRRDLMRYREESKEETKTSVVVLVHGIRTRAL